MKEELLHIREGYNIIAKSLISMAEGKSSQKQIQKACEKIESSRRQLENIVGKSEATRLSLAQLEHIF